MPCKGQELKWKPEQQKRYSHLLKECDEVIVLQDHYTADCMNKRNKYMVENSSVVIVCNNGNQVALAIQFVLQKKMVVRLE